jgi:hypothetical protein
MQNALAGLFLGAVLMVLSAGFLESRPSAYGQFPDRARGRTSGGELVSFAWDTGTHEHLAVLDPQLRVMSIYEVNRTSGSITLKSVRNIGWDLQLEDFNSSNPTPREIRSLVERR